MREVRLVVLVCWLLAVLVPVAPASAAGLGVSVATYCNDGCELHAKDFFTVVLVVSSDTPIEAVVEPLAVPVGFHLHTFEETSGRMTGDLDAYRWEGSVTPNQMVTLTLRYKITTAVVPHATPYQLVFAASDGEAEQIGVATVRVNPVGAGGSLWFPFVRSV